MPVNVAGSSVEIGKVRDLIDHVRAHTDELVDAGIDRELLADGVAAMEKALDEKAHASVVGQTVTSLKGALERASGNEKVRGAITLLNEIFATGIPAP